MIVSKNGTSYDTSDGSEQPHAASATGPVRSERSDINRWEDDGPGPHAHTPAPRLLPSKPSWSVLSLQRLNEAIEREARLDDPSRLRHEAERSERESVAAAQLRQDRAADDDRATRDRHRNAWENT